MKQWNAPIIEELDIQETAQPGNGQGKGQGNDNGLHKGWDKGGLHKGHIKTYNSVISSPGQDTPDVNNNWSYNGNEIS